MLVLFSHFGYNEINIHTYIHTLRGQPKTECYFRLQTSIPTKMKSYLRPKMKRKRC